MVRQAQLLVALHARAVEVRELVGLNAQNLKGGELDCKVKMLKCLLHVFLVIQCQQTYLVCQLPSLFNFH